jgi:ribosomal protein S14
MCVNCSCVHEFQDKRYGKGVRIANPINKAIKEGRDAHRCTVCGREHTLGSIGKKDKS